MKLPDKKDGKTLKDLFAKCKITCFDYPQFYCLKNCIAPFLCWNKRDYFIIPILRIFYNILMIFQNEDERQNNPEWIKFIKSLKA